MPFSVKYAAKALTVLAAGLTAAVAAGLIVGPTAATVASVATALTSIAVYLVPNADLPKPSQSSAGPAGPAGAQSQSQPAPVVPK